MENVEKQNVQTKSSVSFLSSAGKFGFKGLKYFSLVLLIIGFINTIFLIVSIFKFMSVKPISSYLLSIFVVLLIGVLCTIAAVFFTYKYLLIDGIKVIYGHLNPFFKRLSGIIVDKVSNFATDKVHISDKHIEKAFNIGDVFAEVYGKRVPKLMQKGISYIVKRLPLSEFIFNIRDCIRDKEKEKASELLFEQIDAYIGQNILGGNNMKFLYWLIPLNIILQITALYVISSCFAVPEEYIF